MKLIFFMIFLSIAKCYSTNYIDTGKSYKYKPEWSDLDKRPLPKWYDQAKIGIFLHWGVFSVPSFGNEWFWRYWNSGNSEYVNFMKKNYPPGFTYQDFAPQFTAEFFDPIKWATLFAKAGAQYVVLTSKHHEGYTLFPSKRSFSWNSVDIGPRRDIVAELSQAVRKQGIKFGVYHSLFEWYNPIYLEDKSEFYYTRNYPKTKLLPDLKQLVENYKPSVIWSDGDWEALDAYWNSTGFLAWLYNDSPVSKEVVVNDRWGVGIPCHHGDFWTCSDKYNPGTLQPHKWENAFTLDKSSWGYRRNMELDDVMTTEEILYQIISTVSCGGNVNINIGPTKEGTIAPIFQDRLSALGEWLSINGEAIYKTSPWLHQNDTLNGDVWYTCTKHGYNGYHPTRKPRKAETVTAVFALVLKWPKDGLLRINDTTTMLHSGNYRIDLLGQENNYIDWKIENGVTIIQFPKKQTVNSAHAWSLRFTCTSPKQN